MEIHSTKNYSQFKIISANRQIDTNHLSALIKAIKLKNMLKYNPILVSRDYHIYDGQHRFKAAETLKRTLYYIVSNNLELNDLKTLNNTSKKWSIVDYVESFASQDNKDYIYLKEFSTSYNISLASSLYLLGAEGGDGYSRLKKGEFKVKNKIKALDVVVFLNSLDTSHKQYKLRSFVRALSKAFKKDIDKKRLKLVLNAGVKKCDSIDDYMETIQTAYNKNLSKNKRILFVDI